MADNFPYVKEIPFVDWIEQLVGFRKTYNINGISIELDAFSSYIRSPHWCVGVDIDVIVKGEVDKYVLQKTFLLPEKFKSNYPKITRFIGKLDTLLTLVQDNEDCSSFEGSFKEINKFAEGLPDNLKPYSQTEIDSILAEIKTHNERWEELRKKDPFFAVKFLMKPGLASIF